MTNTFTELMGSFTCPPGAMVQTPLFVQLKYPFECLSCMVVGQTNIFFLPALEIEPVLPAWGGICLITIRPSCLAYGHYQCYILKGPDPFTIKSKLWGSGYVP